MNSLKILEENRRMLLLAEAVAWIHDMGKCSDEMVQWQAQNRPSDHVFKKTKHDYKTYPDFIVLLPSDLELKLLGESVPIAELVQNGMPWVLKPKEGKYEKSKYASGSPPAYLVRALGRCHAAAHVEKEEPEDQNEKKKFQLKQWAEDTRSSSPFGFEGTPLTGLTARLKRLPFDYMYRLIDRYDVLDNLDGIISARNEFREKVRSVFSGAPGDTRRPINEVTLWDWSATVAALYKAALAGALLLVGLGEKPPEPDNLRWRFLSVRFKSARFLDRVPALPPLIARRRWLQQGLDRVQNLLEVEYPLGAEVYRDENGSIFVVPDMADILEYKNDEDETLSGLIKKALRFEGELLVTPEIDPQGWQAQEPGKRSINRAFFIRLKDRLSVPVTTADPHKVAAWWDKPAEVCVVSGVRPQGSREDEQERKVSRYWLEQTEGRAKEWLSKRQTTIWLDEVADANGRLCLLVSRFVLDEWLKTEGYVKTLLYGVPGKHFKNSSFARLHRIWRTTAGFWAEIEKGFAETVGYRDGRLIIKGELSNQNRVSSGHAYQLKLEAGRLSIFCTGKEFIVIENLLRAARLLGDKESDLNDYRRTAAYLASLLSNKTFPVENPTGYGELDRKVGELHITAVRHDVISYLPAVSILADPSTFMALVPAGKALEVTMALKDKYEREMNKVRNRLPVVVGLVFASSRMPLTVILEAGRRMLQQPVKVEEWKVVKSNPLDCHHELILERRGHQIGHQMTVIMPTVMGDGKTADNWYPYWEVKEDEHGRRPSGREREFSLGNGTAHEHVWVHVSELRTGDVVYFEPARFDFEFLDTAARRFEISYKGDIRRGRTRLSRPYLLEELADFERIWQILNDGLARSQIKQLEGVIESKKSEWNGQEKAIFEQFVRDAISNANWKNGKRPAEEEIEMLTHAAVCGKFADVVELFIDILKVG